VISDDEAAAQADQVFAAMDSDSDGPHGPGRRYEC
jgi:hypothetical protein